MRGLSWNEHGTSDSPPTKKTHPEAAREFRPPHGGELPALWKRHCAALLEKINTKAETVRDAQGLRKTRSKVSPVLPNSSVDPPILRGSNPHPGRSKAVGREGGNYIYYGFASSA